jgi:DNA mismatch repair ATPase MutS
MLPFCDKALIIDRQDGVAMAARADNIDFVSSVMKLLKRIHDVPRLLLRIKKVLSFEQLRIYVC